jgi:hypothetical protein
MPLEMHPEKQSVRQEIEITILLIVDISSIYIWLAIRRTKILYGIMRTAVACPSLDKFAIFHSLHLWCVAFLHRVVSLTMKINIFIK